VRAARIRFDGDADTPVHLDGEPFGYIPLTVTVVPSALRAAVGSRVR
jgi:diacylglycerol kinase family enzyme